MKSLSLASILVALLALPSAWAAEKLAVADGVATEVIYLLGAEDRLAAVDTTSTYPAAAKELPQIGYFRRLSAEGILSISPDLLIASPNAGPPVALDQVRSAGIEIAVMPDVGTLDDIAPKIEAVGAALSLDAKAAEIAEQVRAEIADLRATKPETDTPPRVMFVLTVRDGTPLVVGQKTPADEVIREAGAVNAADFDRYKPMSREAVIAAAPDLILMTAEHGEALADPNTLLERPEFALTPAGKNKRLLRLPALTVLGLGPRTPGSIRTLREALFP
ncbi:MAG: ABC transporter substrate-binding protein [Pseudomonadota bacterium]